MKLLPKLHLSLTVPTVGLLLAPFTLAQTHVWYDEALSLDYETTTALAPDSAGNIFQAVFTSPDVVSQGDAQLNRYSADGDLAWTASIGMEFAEYPNALASDGLDGVFIVGSTSGDLGGPNAGQFDTWLAHYNGQGQRSWIKQWGTPVYDLPEAAAPDGTGGVFVAGTTNGSLGGQHLGSGDIWLARYDSTGNQLWIVQFGSVSNDRVTSVALDGGGGTVVCGETFGDLAGTQVGNGDAWIARFDSTGAMAWSDQFGTGGADKAQGIASDQVGGVFVAGDTRGSIGGPNAGFNDVWFAHYDATGAQTWIRQIGTADEDTAWEVISDAMGGAFITGRTAGDLGGNGSSAGQNWLGHYDATGSEVGFIQFGAINNEQVVVGAPNQRGGVYLGGIVLAAGSSGLPGLNPWLARYDDVATETYCSPAALNSTGTDGKMSASGSGDIAANDVTLRADDLPLDSFGYFINSQMRGFVAGPTTPGIVCLGSPIGRFVGPGEVLNSGSTGSFSLAIDLNAIPQPNGALAVQPGDTWHFQAWHRDSVGGSASWNFTDGLSVTFR